MEKVKFLLICILGLFCLIYNMGTRDYGIDTEAIKVLLRGQIETGAQDSLIGVVFDRIIAFVFSLNLDDPRTYFRMFGV
ncbi:MAG: hypothetical protein GX661_02995 [Acholeplasmataceae bacterium]|nr:hypothetical protein [Acholeplasmataceae bacterium]